MSDHSYKVLQGGAAASAALLLIFAIAHTRGAAFLDLESRWLAVAGIPLLVALFVGGFIAKFKGFGIELDLALREGLDLVEVAKMPVLQLETDEDPATAEGLAKRSEDDLRALTTERKVEIKRLSFILGHHYIPEVLREYLEELPNLQFLEIRHRNGDLSRIVPRDAIDDADLAPFVAGLAAGALPPRLRSSAVKTFILRRDSFLVAMEKLWNSGLNSLPVVDGSEIVGHLDRAAAFDRIAEALTKSRLGR